MNGTHVVTHDYFRQASADELRELLRLTRQIESPTFQWGLLVNWANGYEPAHPASRMIRIMQEIAERSR